MPRRPRIHVNEVPLHIVQRGHNREPCFFAEEDYQWNNSSLAPFTLKVSADDKGLSFDFIPTTDKTPA